MLPSAMPNTRKSRQPAPLIRPSGRVNVFQEPVTTPTVISTLSTIRTIRRMGNRSASTAVFGLATVVVAGSLSCWVMSPLGPDPPWTRLDATEHRVGADREVGFPVRALQLGPLERDGAPPTDLDAVGVPVRHGQREREHAVVGLVVERALAQGPALQRQRAEQRPGSVLDRHRRARVDVRVARLPRAAGRAEAAVPEGPVHDVGPLQAVAPRRTIA